MAREPDLVFARSGSTPRLLIIPEHDCEFTSDQINDLDRANQSPRTDFLLFSHMDLVRQSERKVRIVLGIVNSLRRCSCVESMPLVAVFDGRHGELCHHKALGYVHKYGS